MSDPLSVGASIVGLILAGGKIISLINKIREIPRCLQDIKIELSSIQIVVSGLQKFVKQTATIDSNRAALIPIQDVIAILTQIVLVYSELETLVKARSGTPFGSTLERVQQKLASGDASADRLLNQLQRHKLSLSLVLQIIQCDSHLEAFSRSEALQIHIDGEIEGSDDLASRLQQLELPDGTVIPDQDTFAHSLVSQGKEDTALANQDIMDHELGSKPPLSIEPSFNQVLASSKVYSRVYDLELDAVSHVSTTRSHGWSVLSGLSCGQISKIAVICLPLTNLEVERFRSIGIEIVDDPPPLRSMDTSRTLYSGLMRQLHEINQNESNMIHPELVGDDMSHWMCAMTGPVDTPYEGGRFFLSIRFPEHHPFRSPRIHFITRIFHPNIDANGRIGDKTLIQRAWNPAMSIEAFLLSILILLGDPILEDGCCVTYLAEMYKRDRASFDTVARKWTKSYAI